MPALRIASSTRVSHRGHPATSYCSGSSSCPSANEPSSCSSSSVSWPSAKSPCSPPLGCSSSSCPSANEPSSCSCSLSASWPSAKSPCSLSSMVSSSVGAQAGRWPRWCAGYSTQSNVRVTAFFQSAYSLSRSAASIRGCHSLSLPQLARRSSTSFQNPTASPAAYAAPSEVVSATVGRITGTSSTSAWNCISVSL